MRPGHSCSACLEQIKLSWREAQCLSHRETDWQKTRVITPAETTRVENIIQFSVKKKTAVVKRELQMEIANMDAGESLPGLIYTTFFLCVTEYIATQALLYS